MAAPRHGARCRQARSVRTRASDPKGGLDGARGAPCLAGGHDRAPTALGWQTRSLSWLRPGRDAVPARDALADAAGVAARPGAPAAARAAPREPLHGVR